MGPSEPGWYWVRRTGARGGGPELAEWDGTHWHSTAVYGLLLGPDEVTFYPEPVRPPAGF